MSKKIKYIPFLCLLLCLTLVACGGKGGDDNNESSTEDSRISAPTDALTDEQTTDTTDAVTEETTEAETTRPDYPSDIIIDPVPIVPPIDTDLVPPPETDSSDTQIEETEHAVVPEFKAEVIELGEAFLAGDPAAGTIISNQSKKIRLVVNYNFQMNADGSVSADFQVGLESYDINCGARVDSGKFIIDGEVNEFSTDAIVHEEREMIFIPFAEYSYQIGAEKNSCSVDASWLFNGVYAGDEIDTLSASVLFTWNVPNPDSTAE